MALDHAQVPKTIPRPVDDGLASHLLGSTIPADLSLVSTQGTSVRLAELPGLTILFCYPRTGAPERHYRDNFPLLTELGANAVFGLSVQDSAYQQEAKERLGLPYDLLSDEKLEFVKAMKMPVFEWEGKPLTKRITLALRDGKVEHVWYPVFPPDENSAQVAAWLGAQ
ncbi:redoxin family protein [Ilyonectria robusta]|uniref:redoxin family protein n=1 Tax=Ilyonectria robusta TaxID=1079257 RepID=UPI001E8CD112|nr:redoxin family protein [Ilyonectria robusta]KAH8656840.1 redoxin family protein [Ilyonectria robusta]